MTPGLIVDALQGAPGVHSARYAGNHATADDNITKLLDALKTVPEQDRTARFHCTLVYLQLLHEPITVEATWEGRILMASDGTAGFGYDPIFFVPTHQCSAGQLSLDEKNRLSHRGKALALLAKELKLASRKARSAVLKARS